MTTDMSPNRLPHALTIAGSDSGGGAGIQADLKTFEALGVFGTSAITAITAQNTQSVRSIEAISATMITDQIDAVREDLPPDAIKIGLVGNATAIEAVAHALSEFPTDFQRSRIVLDPVMVAKTGDRLLEETALQTLMETLVPRVGLLTPNLPEAALLLGLPFSESEGLTPKVQEDWAVQLAAKTEGQVLLKGGHGHGTELLDVLAMPRGIIRHFPHERIVTRNDHGTGCTLSAAIAAYLAHGEAIEAACGQALTYLHKALLAAKTLHFGAGRGPILHAHQT